MCRIFLQGALSAIKTHTLWLAAGGISLLSGGYVLLHGVDFSPGQPVTSPVCEKELGPELSRRGHSEEFIWKGCLVANDSANALRRFIPKNSQTGSCVSCHDGKQEETLAKLWTRFPKVDPASGEAVDLATALRNEIITRYKGLPPNKADPAVEALYFYMATKAKQAGLPFAVEPASSGPLNPPSLVEKASAEPDCASKFDEKGWPTGAAAKHVINGCNLVVNTREHLRGPIARAWPTSLTCQSCHRGAGNLENAANLAHAAVVLPHMLTSMNQPVRFDRRVLMCFERSMNAFDLGLDAQEITNINLYANWLAQKENLPIGVIPKGRGIQPLHDSQSRGQSFLAGEQVYKTYCMGCHGFAGTGSTSKISGTFPPPITGPDSFNATASTADPSRMAGFVLANMPPGATLQNPILTEQQALDVSAYLTQLGRPANITTKNSIQMFTTWLWLRSVNEAAGQFNKSTEQ